MKKCLNKYGLYELSVEVRFLCGMVCQSKLTVDAHQSDAPRSKVDAYCFKSLQICYTLQYVLVNIICHSIDASSPYACTQKELTRPWKENLSKRAYQLLLKCKELNLCLVTMSSLSPMIWPHPRTIFIFYKITSHRYLKKIDPAILYHKLL